MYVKPGGLHKSGLPQENVRRSWGVSTEEVQQKNSISKSKDFGKTFGEYVLLRKNGGNRNSTLIFQMVGGFFATNQSVTPTCLDKNYVLRFMPGRNASRTALSAYRRWRFRGRAGGRRVVQHMDLGKISRDRFMALFYTQDVFPVKNMFFFFFFSEKPGMVSERHSNILSV